LDRDLEAILDITHDNESNRHIYLAWKFEIRHFYMHEASIFGGKTVQRYKDI